MVALGLILTWPARVYAEPPFPEAPEGPYDGPVKIIYTKDNAPATPKVEDLELTDTVSQYGITWKLKERARVGRFITGDYYVVGPVTVVEITPKPLFGAEVEKAGWKLINQGYLKELDTPRYKDKWARNGSMLSPTADRRAGGYDSRLANGYYDPALFKALPIEMKPGDALVSSISNSVTIDIWGHGQPLRSESVLTCMKEPVPVDAFRPSVCDRGQKIYLARDLKRGLLYNLPIPGPRPTQNVRGLKSAPKDLSEWARAFERPWLDIVEWGYADPKDNMPRYGQCIMNGVSTGAMLLHLDYPAVEKEQLLVGYVQYGVDLWGIVRAGSEGWFGHGGFGGGRKWMLVFTGLLLGDDAMRDVSRGYPKVHFGEDDQTKWGKSWQGYDVIFESHPLVHPVFSEIKPPSQWGGGELESWGYRMGQTSVEWPGEALAAHLMRAEKYFNHAPFFAYVDRYMKEDLVAEVKAVDASPPAKGGNNWFSRAIQNHSWGRTSPLLQDLWDKYRNNLPAAKESVRDP